MLGVAQRDVRLSIPQTAGRPRLRETTARVRCHATPLARDGQLQSIEVGFQGNVLAALEILDSFGQRSVLKFSKVEVNPALPAATFDFKVPTGADVVKQ